MTIMPWLPLILIACFLLSIAEFLADMHLVVDLASSSLEEDQTLSGLHCTFPCAKR